MKHHNYSFAFIIAVFFIVSGCATVPKTPLMKASANGDALTVEKLIAEGANINEPDGEGKTPLMHALQYQNAELAEYLIKKGADVNSKDKYGYTALYYAINYPINYQILELLIIKNANINAQDYRGYTVLHSVVQTYGDDDSLKIAEYLLDKNIDASIKDAEGLTALRHAIIFKNVDMVALIRKKTNWQEEIKSLTMNESSPARFKAEKDMFDVPVEKERIFNIASFDCSIMSSYNKGAITILTGPIGYLASMGADAVTGKGKFEKCMEKMGFKCKKNCSNTEKTSNKKAEEPIAPPASIVAPKVNKPVTHAENVKIEKKGETKKPNLPPKNDLENKKNNSSESVQKLRQLKELKEEGLISSEDYERKKKEIIDGI